MRCLRIGVVIVLLVFGVAGRGDAQGLGTLETNDLRLLYFDPTENYLVPHVARSFENAMDRHRYIFDYEPDEKITTLLTDFGDYGNASASAVPRNSLILDIAPLSTTFETLTGSERFYMLMNHELTHIVTTDMATNTDKRMRKFFGGKVTPAAEHPETILYSVLTTPRILTPSWYLEGSAVFLETWLAGGVGRAQGAYDEMVFRAMVRDNTHFYDPLGLVAEGAVVDFQVGVNHYLYGTRFISYLSYTYTPEMVIEWIGRNEGSRRSYRSQFEQVFGMPLEQSWQNWVEWEHKFQRANLESVNQFPTTSYTNLADRALGSISRAFYDPQGNRLLAGFRYPGVVAHIGALSLDDGTIEHIEDIKGPMLFRVTAPAWDPDSKTLFYTADNVVYRDLMAVNTETGKSERLIRDARIGDLVFNKTDGSIWGVRHLNGIATLVRIPAPYKEWNQIISFDYGQVPFDLDISPDGQLLSMSFGEVNGDQSLRIMRLDALLVGDTTPIGQFGFGTFVPEGFVFSPDGKFLFGSSYYTGVSNIFRYELETGEVEAVSNVETGLFRPIPMVDGSLIAFRFQSDGFVPVQFDPLPLEDVGAISFLGTEVIAKHPELADWQVGSAADIPLEDLITHEGSYVPIRNLELESIYPMLEGYKDSLALGINTVFSDPIMLDRLSISASYSPDSDLPSEEKPHVSVDYRHAVVSASPLSGMWKAGARHNYANFYDIFGPTKQSLKGQWYYVGFDKTFISDKPRRMDFSTELNHYTNLDRLPRYQNVEATFDQLTTLTLDLSYENMRSSLGHVDDEKGFKWRTIAAANYVDGDTIPKFFGNFDFGFPLWWKNSSLWFRNSGGLAIGDELDEFANFFFGGFGNNYVDSGIAKRYREEYAMPGFDLNEIFGRNFYRSMIELNLPPWRFRRVGIPGFYLSWARPAIFATALVTNTDSSTLKQDTYNVGTQIDLNFTMLSRLNMMLSVGYAVARGRGADQSEEWMISLKVL
jgi:hypothetical protein